MFTKETLWFNAAIVPNVTTDWFEEHYWREKNALTGEAQGRGTTYFFRHENNEFVLRHYRRGGLPGKLLTDQFWYAGLSRTRAWREMKLLLQLEELELPAPRAIAARVQRVGFYYRSDIITHRIDSAKDLHQYLLTQPLDQDVWHKVGKTIAKFHRFHVYHHDLNIHNIMLDDKGEIWLIDFDKCDIRPSGNWQESNLSRLNRSLLKEQGKHPGYHFKEENWQALMKGYQE